MPIINYSSPKQADKIQPFSLMTQHDHPIVPRTLENSLEMDNVLLDALPVEPEHHSPPFQDEIIVLSTPYFPKTTCTKRKEALNLVGIPPPEHLPVSSAIHLRFAQNRSVYFGVRIVSYNARNKLYRSYYFISDGAWIDTVDATDRDFHYAYDPRTFIRSIIPNTSAAYIESVV